MSQSAAAPSIEARDRILRAAEQLFARKGFAATSVHEITDAAGVNRALLYYYFEDKHSLHTALLEQGGREFGEMLEGALSGPGSHTERLAALIRGHAELIREHGDMCRMVHRCLLDGQQEEFGLTGHFRQKMERLERFLEEGIAAGELRPMNTALVARTILGPTFVSSMWCTTDPEHFDVPALAEQVTRMLLSGLTAER